MGTNTTEYIRVSEALQQMWKQNLGIDIAVKPYDKGTDPQRAAAQIWRQSLGTIINDPSAAVSQMGISTAVTETLGWGGYSNKDVDALLTQAFASLNNSPGARAYYDKQRARGANYNAALRQLANRLVGILHGCLKTGTPYNETTAWSHHPTEATT